ncbi:hypothetical protein BDY24DRAFT_185395 [Mrakia frigida]|uniref:uncharacterized protein n=1 Tax=Mrakia frigida TaxID=29902 RepID=UPI003FCC04D1
MRGGSSSTSRSEPRPPKRPRLDASDGSSSSSNGSRDMPSSSRALPPIPKKSKQQPSSQPPSQSSSTTTSQIPAPSPMAQQPPLPPVVVAARPAPFKPNTRRLVALPNGNLVDLRNLRLMMSLVSLLYSARVLFGKTGYATGTGFVAFATEEEARSALEAMDDASAQLSSTSPTTLLLPHVETIMLNLSSNHDEPLLPSSDPTQRCESNPTPFLPSSFSSSPQHQPDHEPLLQTFERCCNVIKVWSDDDERVGSDLERAGRSPRDFLLARFGPNLPSFAELVQILQEMVRSSGVRW